LNRLRALCLLLPGAFAACSGPDARGSDAATRVRLYDARTGVRLELADDDDPALRDRYSRTRNEANLKLGTDALLEALVERLDDLNFADLSAEGAAPTGADVLGWIEVVVDGRTRSFSVPRVGATAAQLQGFADMQVAFSQAYAHVAGLQAIDNPEGARIFRQPPGPGRPPGGSPP
jgi:hypothetical protein